MKSKLMLAVAAIALSAGTAAAQTGQSSQGGQQSQTAQGGGCDLQAMGEETRSYLQGLSAEKDQVRAVLQDLRDAARRLKAAGFEEACTSVTDAFQTTIAAFEDNPDQVEEMARMRRDWDMQQSSELSEGQKAQQQGQLQPMTDRPLQERLTGLAGGESGVDQLVGINLYNMEDEFLGEVDGVLRGDGGQISHLIVGHGGFWNIGDTEVAIPVELLRWDPDNQVLYSDLTEEQIEDAPDWDRQAGTWESEGNSDYFKQFLR